MNLRTARLFVALLLLVLLASCASSPSKSSFDDRDGPMQHYRRAVMLFDEGQVERALEEIDRSIDLDSDLPAATFYRGYILWNLGRYGEAETSFRDTVRINPLHLDARMYLASCLEQTGSVDAALRELDAAIALPGVPNIEQVRLNKALILERQGRLDQALGELRAAVTTRPRYHRAHFEMAKILEEMGRPEDALLALRAAEPGYAKDAEYHYRLGSLLFHLRRNEEASRSLRRVLDLGPGTEAAARAQELLKVIG